MTEQTSPLPTGSATAIPEAPPSAPPSQPAYPRLRLWPGVLIVLLMWAAIKLPGWLLPGTMFQMYGAFMGPMVAAAAVVAWWLFASGIRWRDRFLALVVLGIATAVGLYFCHPPLRFALIFMGLPAITTAWVGWLLVSSPLTWPVRRAGLMVIFALAAVVVNFLQFNGVYGDFSAQFTWRWQQTAEERLLADLSRTKQASGTPDEIQGEKVVLQQGDWPGFRGPNRDGRLAGVRIATNWQEKPPRLVWRHAIGPGWSSCAIIGNRLYTQEQRGKDELVTCYAADTGKELWAHKDQARFEDPQAGPGPRATPTFHEGKVYALGGEGTLNCLDAATGKLIWSRDIKIASGAAKPIWGFSSSPLVVDGVVTVFAGGKPDKSMLGYHAETGELAWSAGEGPLSYCSPQLAKLGGVEQILIATDRGLSSFQPTSGEVLWQFANPINEMPRIVQPAVLDNGDVLIGAGFGQGTQRVQVQHGSAGWTAHELWTTKAISPYFNDLVVHQDHLYGFDSLFLTCVNLADGQSCWRTRGYRSGQVLLLAEQNLLLVLSELGDVALVDADPVKYKEIARFKALEGKTWNHPVIAHGKLYVRNGEELACYQLAE